MWCGDPDIFVQSFLPESVVYMFVVAGTDSHFMFTRGVCERGRHGKTIAEMGYMSY